MLIICGHGPSILTHGGKWLDDHTIVRLKGAPKPSSHFGSRTDILCANDVSWSQRVPGRYAFWHFPMHGHQSAGASFVADSEYWLRHYFGYGPKFPKPSHGLQAIFCAEELGYDEVGVIGFDSMYGGPRKKWNQHGDQTAWPHDSDTERWIIDDLRIEVINLGVEDGACVAIPSSCTNLCGVTQ